MESPIKVHVIFDDETCREFEFATQAEADAFLVGVDAGCGWTEFRIPTAAELRKIKRNKAKAAAKAAQPQ